MHDTALEIGRLFFENYWQPGFRRIVDLGAYDVNGSLRNVAPRGAAYVGLDLEAGPGVDIVLPPEAPIPLPDGDCDMTVSSSALEHDGFFWNTFMELVRITKPGGYIYINAPSNGYFHRYPHDNWRFYADASRALERWAARCGSPVKLVESFIAERMGDVWNDFVAVFWKGEDEPVPPKAYLCDLVPCTNVWRLGEDGLQRLRERTEDMELIAQAAQPVPASDSQPHDLPALAEFAQAVELAAGAKPKRAAADGQTLQLGLDRLLADAAERRVFQEQMARRLAKADADNIALMAATDRAAHLESERDRLQEACTALRERIVGLEAACNVAQAAQRQAVRDRAQMEGELDGLRNERTALALEGGRLQDDIARLTREMERLEAESGALRDTCAGLEAENARLLQRNADWAHHIEQERQRQSVMIEDLSSAIQAHNKAVALQREVSIRNAELERRLVAWADENKTLRAAIAQIHHDEAIARAHAGNLEQQLARLMASTSWRLTAPLRFARRLLGGGSPAAERTPQ